MIRYDDHTTTSTSAAFATTCIDGANRLIVTFSMKLWPVWGSPGGTKDETNRTETVPGFRRAACGDPVRVDQRPRTLSMLRSCS
jgi:hypothetical protein